jgi:hypothetical protein
MIARPDHLTIRPNLARRWGKAQSILQIDDKTGSSDLPVRLFLGLSSRISDFPQSISVPTCPKSILELWPSRPTEGRFAIVTDVGHRMRWTRQRFARDGIAGRVL